MSEAPSEGWSLENSSECDLQLSMSHPGNSGVCSSTAGLRAPALDQQTTTVGARDRAGGTLSSPVNFEWRRMPGSSVLQCCCCETCSVILGCPEPQWFREGPGPSTLGSTGVCRKSDGALGGIPFSEHPWLSAWPRSLAAWEGTGMPATSQLAGDKRMPSTVRAEGMNFKLYSQPFPERDRAPAVPPTGSSWSTLAGQEALHCQVSSGLPANLRGPRDHHASPPEMP